MKFVPASSAALALALVSGCQRSADSGFLALGANDLGLVAERSAVEGDFLVAAVREAPADRNGDGDKEDSVLVVLDLARGTRALLPYAVRDGFTTGAGSVSFLVDEAAQGRDLDGDGDVSAETVLFVHDLATGVTTDLALAVRLFDGRGLAQEGGVLAFAVSEADQGADLDGDGRWTHDVVHVYEHGRARPLALELATRALPLVQDGRVLVSALEDGRVDWNGDGDRTDQAMLVVDARTGAARSLGRAVSAARAEGELLAFEYFEGEQGGVDLDGDGDLGDAVLEIHDLDNPFRFRARVPDVVDFWVAGGLVGLYASERPLDGNNGRGTVDAGVDLNADGDELDLVAFFYDRDTRSLVDTGVAVGPWAGAAPPPIACERRAAFLASEAAQGGLDLNGDGDADDHVLQLFDARSGSVFSTGAALFPRSLDNDLLALDGEHLVFQEADARLPGHYEVVVMELATGARHRLGRMAERLRLGERALLLSVPEAAAGLDLDGDGDRTDLVLEVHDLVTGTSTNTGLAVLPAALDRPGPEFADERVIVRVPGPGGDGAVLHAVRLR